MAGEHKRSADAEPTPGPWFVGRVTDEGASQADFMRGMGRQARMYRSDDPT